MKYIHTVSVSNAFKKRAETRPLGSVFFAFDTRFLTVAFPPNCLTHRRFLFFVKTFGKFFDDLFVECRNVFGFAARN